MFVARFFNSSWTWRPVLGGERKGTIIKARTGTKMEAAVVGGEEVGFKRVGWVCPP